MPGGLSSGGPGASAGGSEVGLLGSGSALGGPGSPVFGGFGTRRSNGHKRDNNCLATRIAVPSPCAGVTGEPSRGRNRPPSDCPAGQRGCSVGSKGALAGRSEEHTSELQS